jgi:thiamine pyrophosphate-dependent acetolactate synthase large subunit-like protein
MTDRQTSNSAAPARVAKLHRREVIRTLLADRTGLFVVSGLGSSSYELMAAGDNNRNFYLWGAMGSAAMVGAGLATARPDDRFLVITGDGEQLMGLGALATIGALAPRNLTVVVLDNQHYGETGMQQSHTALGVDLARIAAASGFAWALAVEDETQLGDVRSRLSSMDGPGFASVLIRAEAPVKVYPPRDGVELKNRFRREFGLATM